MVLIAWSILIVIAPMAICRYRECFKNTYELLNLKAFQSFMFYKILSFNAWVRYFVWNFKGTHPFPCKIQRWKLQWKTLGLKMDFYYRNGKENLSSCNWTQSADGKLLHMKIYLAQTFKWSHILRAWQLFAMVPQVLVSCIRQLKTWNTNKLMDLTQSLHLQ